MPTAVKRVWSVRRTRRRGFEAGREGAAPSSTDTHTLAHQRARAWISLGRNKEQLKEWPRKSPAAHAPSPSLHRSQFAQVSSHATSLHFTRVLSYALRVLCCFPAVMFRVRHTCFCDCWDARMLLFWF